MFSPPWNTGPVDGELHFAPVRLCLEVELLYGLLEARVVVVLVNGLDRDRVLEAEARRQAHPHGAVSPAVRVVQCLIEGPAHRDIDLSDVVLDVPETHDQVSRSAPWVIELR